jgi:recombination protein RecA
MASPSLLSPRGLFAPEHEYFRPADPPRSPVHVSKPAASPDLDALHSHTFPARELDQDRQQRLPHLTGVTRASLLEVRPAPATVPTGIPALDALISGIPRGALTEFFGPASSGRTSVLLSLLAEMTRRQEVCALVDVSDSFHPHSAAAAGVDLDRLLWIRCGVGSTEYRRVSTRQEHSVSSTQHSVNTESRHPERCEGSTVRQHLALSNQHSVPLRSNVDLAECRMLSAECSNSQRGARDSALGSRYSQFRALEQALKVTDLLLQSSGFGLVAVDLGDIPAQIARRVPLTSWFRFRRAVENTPTVLLVMEQEPYAKTCASLVLKMSPQSSLLRNEPATELPTHARLLRGLGVTAELVRSRLERKPSVSVAAFETHAPWEKKAM